MVAQVPTPCRPDGLELSRRIGLGLSILNWREDDPVRAVELARLALHGATLAELVALEAQPLNAASLSRAA